MGTQDARDLPWRLMFDYKLASTMRSYPPAFKRTKNKEKVPKF